MLTCRECVKDLYPDDPRVRAGRHNLCGCDYCDKPETCRQLETQPPQEQVVIHRHSSMSRLEYDLLQQTAHRLQYLEKQLANQAKKRSHRYISYKD